MTDTKAKVVGINGNMVTIQFDGEVSMNEVGYVNVDGKKTTRRSNPYPRQ